METIFYIFLIITIYVTFTFIINTKLASNKFRAKTFFQIYKKLSENFKGDQDELYRISVEKYLKFQKYSKEEIKKIMRYIFEDSFRNYEIRHFKNVKDLVNAVLTFDNKYELLDSSKTAYKKYLKCPNNKNLHNWTNLTIKREEEINQAFDEVFK